MAVLRESNSVDYGIDAPGIRIGMMVIAGIGAAILVFAGTVSALWARLPSGLLLTFRSLGLVVFLYGAWMSSYMTWSSRIGKLRTRDRLLERAGRLRAWRGDEAVADIGCGRGLMLIGAAKRLTRGTAIGIDLWRNEDQSGNSAEAVMENARREGVADRINVETGDARALPLADESVDVVLSHWVVHNLASDRDQRQALNEMWRVLRPGGTVVLADIAHTHAYLDHLVGLGASSCDMLDGGVEARIMGYLSGGTYKPQAFLCVKPPIDDPN